MRAVRREESAGGAHSLGSGMDLRRLRLGTGLGVLQGSEETVPAGAGADGWERRLKGEK